MKPGRKRSGIKAEDFYERETLKRTRLGVVMLIVLQHIRFAWSLRFHMRPRDPNLSLRTPHVISRPTRRRVTCAPYLSCSWIWRAARHDRDGHVCRGEGRLRRRGKRIPRMLACMPMLLPPEEVDFCPVIASRQTKLAVGSR